MTLFSSSRRLAFFLVLIVIAAPVSAASPDPARGTGGAVASAAPAATEAGLEILRAGGNAVDAAVATAIALAVVHPQAGNLGGGGFAVVRMDGEVSTLDFREAAPAAADHDMYLDAKGDPVTEKSLVGPLAAGVPGSPAGLWELHRRYGSLEWARVVAPAARLAGDGFVVTSRLERSVAKAAKLLGRFPETAAVWLPGGKPPAAGSVMKIPDLAATLHAYAEKGPEAITGGAAGGGHRSRFRPARRHSHRGGPRGLSPGVARAHRLFDAFGWNVVSMPLPSSGGIILGQTTGLLERVEWQSAPRFGAERARLLVEAWRRAYADRVLLGDPSTTRATAADLLDESWLDARALELDSPRATPSADVGSWGAPDRT